MSHSGLAVAVALTRDPSRHAAAVYSDAPIDTIRYPRFGISPLWTPEFGTPNDLEHLAVLLSYSPCHQVKLGTDYPPVLPTSARVDPRVGAAHAQVHRRPTARHDIQPPRPATHQGQRRPRPGLRRPLAGPRRRKKTSSPW